MKKIFFFFAAFVLIGELTAQVTPPQKALTNNAVVTKSLQFKDSITGGPVRFSVAMGENYGKAKDFSFGVRYNINPFAVSISGTEITIKKSGLYHFEGFVAAEDYENRDKANGFTSPQFTSSLFVGNADYTIGYRDLMPVTEHMVRGAVDSRNFKYSKSFSMDIHITAPAIIKFNRHFVTFNSNESLMSAKGWMTGYLITE
jgi:hypothetical protein